MLTGTLRSDSLIPQPVLPRPEQRDQEPQDPLHLFLVNLLLHRQKIIRPASKKADDKSLSKVRVFEKNLFLKELKKN